MRRGLSVPIFFLKARLWQYAACGGGGFFLSFQ
jgi:hypothetical protein